MAMTAIFPSSLGDRSRNPRMLHAFRTAMKRGTALAAMTAIAATMAFTAGWSAPAAAGDAAAGQRVYNQCRPCHQVGEKARHTVGPTLNGLFGRKAGTVDGYNFSRANRDSGVVWDEDNFRTYIRNPRQAMPGTKMAYAGLRRDDQIEDLIAYLRQFEPDGKIREQSQ